MPRPALVVAGVLLVGANLRAAITPIGPVLGDLQHDFGLPSFAASALISLPVLAFAFVSPLAPMLARRIGIAQSLALALGGLIVGILLRSTPMPGALWGGTIVLGASIAVLNVELPALVKRDFPTRIGQLTGTYSAVQSGFAAIAAGLAVPLATTAMGWRLSLGVWAGLALIAFGVLAPQLRADAASRTSGDEGPRAAPQPAPATRSPWRSALGWQITVFMGLQSVGYYVLITWLPSIERSAGISAAQAGFHQLLFNACAIGGSLSASELIRRLRDQRLLAAIGPGAFIACFLGLLFAPRLAIAWACIGGVAGGASIVLALSLFGLRTEHHTQAAALSGMAQSVGYLLAAAGPLAVGALHDLTGSWTPALLLLLAVGLVLAGVGQSVGRDRVIGRAARGSLG